MITQERLHELFEYREDGTLVWRVDKGSAKKGMVAGSIRDSGYYRMQINRKGYQLHRIIFLYHHGHLTDGLYIDHIDGNKTNNRIENLREVTQSQNRHNSKISVTNTSGIKGISFHKKRKKWHACIMLEYKSIFLGEYKSLEEAEAVVKEAREKYHGEYARHE
jgi:hypothetical protein